MDFDPELVKAMRAYKYGNYLIIVERHISFTEIYYFGSSAQLTSINQFYLNNIDLFQMFISFFKSKAVMLIEKYQSQRLIYPNSNDNSELTNANYTESLYLPFLTQRENECMRYYKQGYTAKITARILDISHRTVEYYLKNIKEKLQIFFNEVK